jgi:RNA polymerase sigma factor (sigma-70 family)
MSKPTSNDSARGAPDHWGGPTRWSLIHQAADSSAESTEVRNRAWRELIERYREPVRSFFRRALRGHPQAEDASEGFFSYLFEHRVLNKADPDHGRFRCYAQGVARRYAKSWLRTLEPDAAVEMDELITCADDPTGAVAEADEATWAEQVLELAVGRLRAEHERDAELLVRLHGLFGRAPTRREDLCAEFEINMNALGVALNRARTRLGESIVAEVCETVVPGKDFDFERRMIIERLLAAHPGLLSEHPG